MPKTPIPADLDSFLAGPNLCVVASVRPDGELHTAATWYEWLEDRTVLLNMDGSRARLRYLRLDPRIALTVLGAGDWYSHVSLAGTVTEIRRDPDLADIDRLSLRYDGRPYDDRSRDSWTAIVTVARWHAWGSALRS